jgi:hypothetical protein
MCIDCNNVQYLYNLFEQENGEGLPSGIHNKMGGENDLFYYKKYVNSIKQKSA